MSSSFDVETAGQALRFSRHSRSISPVSSIADFHSTSSRMTLRDDFVEDERSKLDSADTIDTIRDSGTNSGTASTSAGKESAVRSTRERCKEYSSPVQETTSSDGDAVSSILQPSLEASMMSPWHEKLFVFNVCLAQVLSLASLAMTVAPVLIIGKSFGVIDLGQCSW